MNGGLASANAVVGVAVEPYAEVNIAMENSRIVIDPRPGERYRLAALLAACDAEERPR